eukprot:1414840-Rhodomonas_salina.1
MLMCASVSVAETVCPSETASIAGESTMQPCINSHRHNHCESVPASDFVCVPIFQPAAVSSFCVRFQTLSHPFQGDGITKGLGTCSALSASRMPGRGTTFVNTTHRRSHARSRRTLQSACVGR